MRPLALVALGVALVAACAPFESGDVPTPPAANDGGSTSNDAAASAETGAPPAPLCPDCTPTKLTDKAHGIYGLAIDSDFVFAGTDDGRILRIAKGDGDVLPLATGQKNAKIVTSSGDWVYFGADNGVFRVGKSGQPLQRLSDLQETAVTVVGDHVYACRYEVTQARDVVRLDSSVDGGVKLGNTYGCESMSASGEFLFFGGSGSLNRARLDGADAGGTLLGDYPARRVVVDGAYVYSVAWGDGVVRRIGIGAAKDTPAESVAKIDDTTTEEGDLTVDATHVYWTIGRNPGRVLRAPKSIGATVEVLAKDVQHPRGIAVDDTSVYWGEEDSGTLWVRRK